MAAPLTPVERRERQRADHRLLAALDADNCPIRVSGHRTAEDVRANRAPVSVDDPVPPDHYRVVYDFDTLRGPGRRHRPTVVHVAPLANGAYPTTAPSAWVVSKVIPWTPHFAANVPICHGTHVWIANRTQLVDYVTHIGKLLNFDEPPPTPGYHGYNGAAVAYWHDTMRLRPLDPDLRFPTFRLEDVVRVPIFRRAADHSPGPRRFAPAQDPRSPVQDGRFRPARQRLPRGFSPAGHRP
jgi:hypothetical protein